MGIIAAYASSGAYYSPDTSQQLVSDSVELGTHIGARSYSKQQEREADYLAVYIIHDAGFDIQNARKFILTMAKSSELGVKRLQGFLGTHPSGPERFASIGLVIQEIQHEGIRMPRKRSSN